MVEFKKGLWVLLAVTASLLAKAGAREDDKPSAGIEAAIRHTLETQQFTGGQVQELLLADPESHGPNAIYQGEFAVRRAGRLIRCEDWRFTVHRVPEGWAILKTERGRCND
ncbi:MAG: hypothetical protein ACOY5B_03965 [Spirochaetota bacterium]